MLHTYFTEILNSAKRREYLVRSMYQDRYAQFYDRLGWELSITINGLEFDEYDDHHTTYVVVSDQDEHLGSFRLRSVQCGTMISDHFAKELPATNTYIKQNGKGAFEITRFLCKPNLSMHERSVVMSLLAEGFDQAWKDLQCRSVVGVVFPAIFRLLRRAGFSASVIENERLDSRRVISFALQKSDCRRAMASHRYQTFMPDISIFKPALLGSVAQSV